jgi:transglutaminase-like putative cysteine protease
MIIALGWRPFLAVSLTLLVVLLLHARAIPPTILGVLLLTLALRVWQRKHGQMRTHWALRLALLFGLAALVWASLGNLFGREAGSALLACMLVLKLLETHTRRDARVLVAVAFFFAMCAFLFEQGIVQTIATFVAVVLALATLYELEPDHATGPSVESHWPLSREAARTGLRHVLFALPFAAVCFLFFPRLSAPMWGAPEDAFGARTGLSDTMEPGAISALALDDTPVMRVEFQGALPPPEQRYWRGMVFWWFDGSTWTGANALDGVERATRRSQVLAIDNAADAVSYEVFLEPTDQRWLFQLDMPVAAPEDATLTADRQTRANQPVSSLLRYTGRSVPTYRMSGELPQLQRAIALRIPADGNPRARALAAQWREQTSDPRALAERALAMFNAAFVYSLEPPLAAGDPVDDFLFTTKIGFCEHYASAFVFLMRAAGVPARVVVGFYGGYRNAAGNYLLVRRADAHAWTEIWIDGEGWVRIDPTSAVAPERVQESARDALARSGGWMSEGWLGSIRDRLDVLGYWWNRAVVEFSAARQRNFLADLGLDKSDYLTLTALLVGGTLLALALAAWFGRPRRARAADPVLAAWRAWCAKLARAGVPRAAQEGPRDFGERAAAALPEHAETIRAFTADFVALRYAADDATSPRARAFVRGVARYRVTHTRAGAATKPRRGASST